LFRQRRIGKDGREFTVFKFRSMVVDAEARLAELVQHNERHGPLFKVDVDPRITRIGRFLRATSIDELPQLINVVRGEMTLVGPRPALADEVAQFDEELLRRLRVVPGVTGLWQVEARDNPSFDAYRSLDLFYVDNWSIGIDIAILVSTAAAVLARSVRALRRHPPTPAAEADAHSGVGIGGVPIDWIEIDEAIARIADGAKARSFVQVSTVNLDFLASARRDPEAKRILTESWLSLPDGAPVVWLGRLRGARPSGRVAGADLVPRLAAKAAAERIDVFFLGGENGSARTAADRLVTSHPELRVSVYEPPRAALEDMDDAEIFRRLAEAQPALLLVAFGHPKQEKWIHRNRHRLPMVAMGVGCSFDLIAGHQRRAPLWMQRGGLEWAYRLACEPRRLVRRYVTDAFWLVSVFFPSALYHRVVRRSDPGRAPSVVNAEMSPSAPVLALPDGDPQLALT
jgi:exopolysaccharide biosynthesis WecB/TagA/CpsF family protein